MRRMLSAAAVMALATWGWGTSALGVTSIGSLSNFDVVNDTGGTCEGFEIELEGVHSSDVSSTFGAPYNRFGDPVKEDTPTGVIVRWSAKWDPNTSSYDTATPLAPAGISPGGHDCYLGGPIGDYLNSGCEHFGISLRASQTATTYRWLVADPNNPGSLIGGAGVPLPAPLFSQPAPQPGVPPAPVQAMIEAPREPGDQREFGDAYWAKLIKTHVNSQDDLELDDLFVGDPNDPNVMGMFNPEDEDEPAEIEWFLIQDRLNGQPGENELGQELAAGADDKGVAFRFEFFNYTGPFDAENHEALPDGDIPLPEELGSYIGAQMAGVNLFNAVPEPATCGLAVLGLIALARRRR
ncbi:MAG: PEP-CTERM sorting domain-containing protein [Planctomycetales bacterium]|nr:PEP-CTERM sorting domain-containing protein [Planctomycetales bacterium]